ncbi:MAG: acyl-CoA dehydrogenase family protein, partial [Rickettsiales bacterium]
RTGKNGQHGMTGLFRQSTIKEASMANLACTEALLRTTEECMRVYGGYGLTMEFDIQRHFRDARLFVIGDGSSQIQRNLIARGMGL